MQLRVATRGERQPPARGVDAPGVHVWRTADGELIAYGYREDATCWMHWPSVGAFRFDATEPCITAFVEPGVSRPLVDDVYRRSVLPMARQALGDEALHASGVLTSRGVVAFAGRSHAGKSTFAYALSRRGFAQWADDGVVIRVSGGAVHAVPLAFQVRLRPESSRLFGEHARALRQFDPPVSIPPSTGGTPLAAICLLERLDAATATLVEQMDPARAFTSVLVHAHEFNPHDDARRRRMLEAYLELVAAVPVFTVQFPSGAEHMDDVFACVTRALNVAPVPAPAAI